jgi:hypothetical protein
MTPRYDFTRNLLGYVAAALVVAGVVRLLVLHARHP